MYSKSIRYCLKTAVIDRDDHVDSLCTLKSAMQLILLNLLKVETMLQINVRKFNGLACSFLNEIPHMLMMVYVYLSSEEVMEHLHVLTHRIPRYHMATVN